MNAKVNNFTVLESVYGKFIINRHCAYQAEALVKTGFPHIEMELRNILGVVSSLSDNAVVVDAGANAGLVCVPIAQVLKAINKGGIVHAFEVQRMMYYALCGSAALNDLENLYIHNKAVGSKPGTLKAGKPDYGKPQDFGLFSLVNQNDPNAVDEVPVMTIDSLNLPGFDFFKIDVEGMEIDVLKGAQKSIKKYKPWCWVEYWKVDVKDIKKQFEGLDYKFYTMDKLNMLCAPVSRLTDKLNINAPEA
jgi:FkbM family methyltransferase